MEFATINASESVSALVATFGGLSRILPRPPTWPFLTVRTAPNARSDRASAIPVIHERHHPGGGALVGLKVMSSGLRGQESVIRVLRTEY